MVQGNIAVADELTLYGMVTGTAVVENGGILRLHGMVRNLVVEPGGAAHVFGMVTEDAHNRGGRLNVSGTVNGRRRAEAGTTRVHDDSKILGGVLGAVEPLA